MTFSTCIVIKPICCRFRPIATNTISTVVNALQEPEEGKDEVDGFRSLLSSAKNPPLSVKVSSNFSSSCFAA